MRRQKCLRTFQCSVICTKSKKPSYFFTMKLERLSSSKFESFKGSELQNAFQIVGGVQLPTRPIGGAGGAPGCDTLDTDTGGSAGDIRQCFAIKNGSGVCVWQTSPLSWAGSYEVLDAYPTPVC